MPLSRLSDGALIDGCLKGRREHWDEFVERFSRLVWWSIHRILGKRELLNRDDAIREVYQEVFQMLLERDELEKLKSIVSLRKYLMVMSSHRAMDKLKTLERNAGRTLSVSILVDEEESAPSSLHDSPDAKQEVFDREKFIIVSDVFHALAPKERTCVEWHYLEGRSHREIAEVLGLPTDTVSTVIRRAREKMKDELAKKGIQ